MQKAKLAITKSIRNKRKRQTIKERNLPYFWQTQRRPSACSRTAAAAAEPTEGRRTGPKTRYPGSAGPKAGGCPTRIPKTPRTTSPEIPASSLRPWPRPVNCFARRTSWRGWPTVGRRRAGIEYPCWRDPNRPEGSLYRVHAWKIN